MANYIGFTPEQFFSSVQTRFFYGLRRTDEGELFVAKMDQLKKEDSIAVNNPGNPEDNYDNFEEGQDFFEGRDVNHRLVYENLRYEQYKWDNQNIYYYINDEGELVARINQEFDYIDTVSSSGE
jgi:hypothetical protein